MGEVPILMVLLLASKSQGLETVKRVQAVALNYFGSFGISM